MEFIEGTTQYLISCSGNRYAVRVIDPEGVERVIVQFVVSSNPAVKSFADPDATLELKDESESLWSGYFDDNISRFEYYTVYRFVAFDKNGISTLLYIPSLFNFYAVDTGCGIIPG
jgi:hypothetical protein